MSPFLAYFCFNFYSFYQYFQESHWNTTWTHYCNWSYSPSSLCYNKPDIKNVINLNTSLFLMSSDAIVSQVLDELGLTMSDELSSKTTQRFHTFSSVVFVCPFLNDFVFPLQIFRALAEACQWLQERRRMPRAHRWTPMPIWRRDCKTYGENERSSCWMSTLWQRLLIQAYSHLCSGFLCGGVTGGSRLFFSKWSIS